MTGGRSAHERALTAVLVARDRVLAESFLAAAAECRVFEILSDLKDYPPPATLEMRLRQIQPDVVLMDVAADFDAAVALMQAAASVQPPIHVVGLHHRTDPEAVIRCFRAGAAEFLAAPFGAEAQREAAIRLRRLRDPGPGSPRESGTVVAFAPAKPGSGASTAATQCAFALKRATGGRVLLVDLDTQAGSIAFHLKLQPTYSVLDAVERSSRLDPGVWSALVANAGGVDVLAAPETPASGEVDSNGLHEVLEYSRMLYDWVVVDLPSAFHRVTLFVLSEADAACLVATSDLASLHMARRAVSLLGQLGFSRERYQMVVNRMDRKASLTASDMEKIFGCPVFATLPEDPHSVHRMVTRVEAASKDSELGRALDQLAGKIRSLQAAGGRAGKAGSEGRAAMAESSKAG